jgi:hypothetical protein
MDVGAMRTIVGRVTARPVLAGVAACALLAVPIIWSVRQSRLTQQALDRAAAAEQAAARIRSDLEQSHGRIGIGRRLPKDPAVRRSRHDDPKEIERVRQLYAEIDGLTRIQERIGGRPAERPTMPTMKPAAAPGPTP